MLFCWPEVHNTEHINCYNMNRFQRKFASKREPAKLVLFLPKKYFRTRAPKIGEIFHLQFQAGIKDDPGVWTTDVSLLTTRHFLIFAMKFEIWTIRVFGLQNLISHCMEQFIQLKLHCKKSINPLSTIGTKQIQLFSMGVVCAMCPHTREENQLKCPTLKLFS